jgi:hypothetical protein
MDAFLFPDSSLQMLITHIADTAETAPDRSSVADLLPRRVVLAWT